LNAQQTPNLAHIERRLPDSLLLESKRTTLPVEQAWNERNRRITGWCDSIVEGEPNLEVAGFAAALDGGAAGAPFL